MTNTRFTVLPCGLKLRLNVIDGEFILKGDMGQAGTGHPTRETVTRLIIVTSTQNLLALSAFFLARAQEQETLREDGPSA